MKRLELVSKIGFCDKNEYFDLKQGELCRAYPEAVCSRTFLKGNLPINLKQFHSRLGAFRISGWWPEKEKQRSIE